MDWDIESEAEGLIDFFWRSPAYGEIQGDEDVEVIRKAMAEKHSQLKDGNWNLLFADTLTPANRMVVGFEYVWKKE